MRKILLLLVVLCMVTPGYGQKATGGSAFKGSVKIGILHSLSGTMAISEPLFAMLC